MSQLEIAPPIHDKQATLFEDDYTKNRTAEIIDEFSGFSTVDAYEVLSAVVQRAEELLNGLVRNGLIEEFEGEG